MSDIDGVIKYNFDFVRSSPLDKSLWSDIEQVRARLYALKLIGVTKDNIGYGNISQRVDKESFVITGTQTGELVSLDAKGYSKIESYDDKKVLS